MLTSKTDSLHAEVRDLHCKLNENNSTLSHLLTQFAKFFNVYNNNTATSTQPASTCAPTGAMGSVDVAANAAETTADTAANPLQPIDAAAAASISTATPIAIAATSQSSSPTSGTVVKPPVAVSNHNEWRTAQNKEKTYEEIKIKIKFITTKNAPLTMLMLMLVPVHCLIVLKVTTMLSLQMIILGPPPIIIMRAY